MARHRVAATARINAPAPVVYGILADYLRHHPRILPKAFRNLVVERGGIGAGAVFSFDLHITRAFPTDAEVNDPLRQVMRRDSETP